MDHDQTPRWDNDPAHIAPPLPVPLRVPLAAHEQTNRQEADSEEDDQDSELSGSKKKKRFRKLFKQLFPSIARKEEVNEAREPIFTAAPILLRESSPQSAEDQTHTDIPDTEAIKSQTAVHQESPEPQSPDAIEVNVVPDPVEAESMPEVIAQPSPERQDVPPELIVPPVVEAATPSPSHAEAAPLVVPPASSSPETPSRSLPAIVTAGVAGFMSGDFFRRQRDRRYRKRTRTLEEQTKRLQKELQTQQQKRSELKSELSKQYVQRVEHNNRHISRVEPASAEIARPSIHKEQHAATTRQEVVSAHSETLPEQPIVAKAETTGFWGSANPPLEQEPVIVPRQEVAQSQAPEKETKQPAHPETVVIKEISKDTVKEQKPSIIPERHAPRAPEEIVKSKETDFDRHEIMDDPASLATQRAMLNQQPISGYSAERAMNTNTSNSQKHEDQASAGSAVSELLSQPLYAQSMSAGAIIGMLLALVFIAFYTFI